MYSTIEQLEEVKKSFENNSKYRFYSQMYNKIIRLTADSNDQEFVTGTYIVR